MFRFFARRRLISARLRTSLLLVCFFSLAISISVFVYWFSSGYWVENLHEQIESRQVVLARAAAIAFENFFKDRGSELMALTNDSAVQNLNEEAGRQALVDFLAHLQEKDNLIKEVARVDKTGQVVWSVATADLDTGSGTIVADRDYFKWARDDSVAGQTMISEPLWARGGLVSGKLVVLLVAPVYRQGIFDGLVFIPIETQELLDRYLPPLLPNQISSGAVVITRSGLVVGGTMGNAGSRLTDRLNEAEANFFTERFLNGKEGSLVHKCFLFHNSGAIETRISSFSPTMMPGLRWVIVISTPYEKVRQLVQPLRFLEMIGFTVSIFCILATVLVAIFWHRITERRAFLNGYRHAQKKLIKK